MFQQVAAIHAAGILSSIGDNGGPELDDFEEDDPGGCDRIYNEIMSVYGAKWANCVDIAKTATGKRRAALMGQCHRQYAFETETAFETYRECIAANGG